MPHSEIHGSRPTRGSPWLFAACHVLHRLLAPRHPPNALLTLDQPRTRENTRAAKMLLTFPEHTHDTPGAPAPDTRGACPSLHLTSHCQTPRPSNQRPETLPKTGRGSHRQTPHPSPCQYHLRSSATCDPVPPATPARWWAREDLNFRPHAYQARALTN